MEGETVFTLCLMIKKSDRLLVSRHTSPPGIDSYWSCETLQRESEEERREFFALRSLLHLGEMVQVAEERRVSRLHFLILTAPPNDSLLDFSLFFYPVSHFIYITNFSTFSDCSFCLTYMKTDSLQYLPSLSPLQAFFNDKYMQEHPEDLEKIEKLKDFIAWQVRLKLIKLICSYVE